MQTTFLPSSTIIGSSATTTIQKSDSGCSTRLWTSSVHPPRREPEPLSSRAVISDGMRLSSIETLNCIPSRDSEYPGGVKLGMLVQLRLLKGRRNRGNPSVSQPRWINLTTDESSLDLRSNL